MTGNGKLLKDRNRVDEMFADRTLLITGGTGFMGKVLVEKVLRTCPSIKRIYLLIRNKKGKNPQERLKELFNSAIFDLLKNTEVETLKKVAVIYGDVLEENLGLSKEDREMLINETNVVYHLAATIRFDDPLKKAVLLNVRGTKYMLDLAKECKNLIVFNHVSTAYCHLKEKVLYERAYPPPADPHMIIKLVEWMDERVIDSITDRILDGYPNTYAFTKALAEALVVDEMDNLHVTILRPPVVVPIWKEPIPGWTDNINGPMGLLIAAGKGVLRTMYCDSQGYADFLPVDIAVNAMLLTCMDSVVQKKRRIYNCTSSFEYKVSWQEIIEIGKRIVANRIPLNGVVWYPGGSMKSSRLHHYLCVILFHYIPAIILDSIIFLSGNKPVLWRVQQRITKGFDIFEYYANNQWDFNNDCALQARDLLTERELELYKVDGQGMDLDEYFYHCTHAARLYILKEGDETIAGAKRHMMIMWCVDKLCKCLLVLGFLYLMYQYFLKPLM
uniref:Fatty acyl-CoA reductase n=2 Tax=Photinus pyralis TaxID=7054 RepID=A0A1Y1MBE1_PHOPY